VDAYELVLTGGAAMAIATASRAEQRKLAHFLDRLKGTPFRRGDFQERDAEGRVNEVVVEDDWLIKRFLLRSLRRLL